MPLVRIEIIKGKDVAYNDRAYHVSGSYEGTESKDL